MLNRLGKPPLRKRPSDSRNQGIVMAPLDAGHCRRLGEGAAQLGMVGRAMVAFAVVLPDELPVAVLDDRALERDLGFADVVRARR